MESSPFVPWEFDDATCRLSEAGSSGERLSHTTRWGAERPTDADLWLLRIVYEFVAGETGCTRCGSPLGRRLRVDYWPTLLGALRWHVAARTRCRGWRRHAHIATIGRCSHGLVLSRFRRRHR